MSSAAGGNLPLVPELVEQTEIRVKSALATAGAPMIQGWLRSGIIAEIDPTGLYFLRRPRPIRAL